MRARDAGYEVIGEGIRLTPAQIVRAAVDEDVHVVGLSILSARWSPRSSRGCVPRASKPWWSWTGSSRPRARSRCVGRGSRRCTHPEDFRPSEIVGRSPTS